jgi:hypothetical protein
VACGDGGDDGVGGGGCRGGVDYRHRRASRTHRPVTTNHGFVFIRPSSATPLVVPALNSQDGSSSSSLTSTNVSLLTSPQPEKRKVAGSIPALATQRLFPPRDSHSVDACSSFLPTALSSTWIIDGGSVGVVGWSVESVSLLDERDQLTEVVD